MEEPAELEETGTEVPQMPCVFCLVFSSNIDKDQDCFLKTTLLKLLTDVQDDKKENFKGVDPWQGISMCASCSEEVFTIKTLHEQIKAIRALEAKMRVLVLSLLEKNRQATVSHTISPLNESKKEKRKKYSYRKMTVQGLEIKGPSTGERVKIFYKGDSEERVNFFLNWIMYRSHFSKAKSPNKGGKEPASNDNLIKTLTKTLPALSAKPQPILRPGVSTLLSSATPTPVVSTPSVNPIPAVSTPSGAPAKVSIAASTVLVVDSNFRILSVVQKNNTGVVVSNPVATTSAVNALGTGHQTGQQSIPESNVSGKDLPVAPANSTIPIVLNLRSSNFASITNLQIPVTRTVCSVPVQPQPQPTLTSISGQLRPISRTVCYSKPSVTTQVLRSDTTVSSSKSSTSIEVPLRNVLKDSTVKDKPEQLNAHGKQSDTVTAVKPVIQTKTRKRKLPLTNREYWLSSSSDDEDHNSDNSDAVSKRTRTRKKPPNSEDLSFPKNEDEEEMDFFKNDSEDEQQQLEEDPLAGTDSLRDEDVDDYREELEDNVDHITITEEFKVEEDEEHEINYFDI